MDIPPYVIMTEEDEMIYHQDFNQTLRTGLSNNGWTVPQLTRKQLMVDQVQNPQNGVFTTLDDLMPDGTLWYVIDEQGIEPPCYVGKISGVLVKFNTSPL